ncbi:MAG: hypothetical protein GXP08_04710 [Gammaproteobacteria bacterium]|nr:hypothetical protein [Gammaproteobacteria bacterium]
MNLIKMGILVCLAMLISLPTLVSASAIKKTVEAVHLERTKLSGKQVQIRGKVVKVNNGIMKRNFLHVKDGSGKEGTDDLIVTSKQTANIGDDVTVIGTVVLDTDFGFGYAYPLLVEKSEIQKH